MKHISIIIPAKNESKNIQSVIENWNGDSFDWIELVFVTGGSTDDTLDKLYEFRNKFLYCFKSILIHDMKESGVLNAVKTGIELANEYYVMFHSMNDPMAMIQVWNIYQERLKYDDDVHVVVNHEIKNEFGKYITTWKVNINADVREYLHEELVLGYGRLSIADSIFARSVVLPAYYEMERRLKAVGLTEFKVCFDVMLMDQMILMGLIKYVVLSETKATFVIGTKNNSLDKKKRIQDIPIVLANIYSQIKHAYKPEDTIYLSAKMKKAAEHNYGLIDGESFVKNYLMYCALFDAVESKQVVY